MIDIGRHHCRVLEDRSVVTDDPLLVPAEGNRLGALFWWHWAGDDRVAKRLTEPIGDPWAAHLFRADDLDDQIFVALALERGHDICCCTLVADPLTEHCRGHGISAHTH